MTLRNALRLSLNTVTVRLAQDIGMPLIGEYAKRFGVYDELPNYLSYALGAGETTVMRMVTAYSMFANGGRRVKADPDRPHPGSLRPHHLQARRSANAAAATRPAAGRTSPSRSSSTAASRCWIR